jgi:hypothetical protein
MILNSRPRFIWLWALLIGLSVFRGASTNWLPHSSQLHESLYNLMSGLPACRR